MGFLEVSFGLAIAWLPLDSQLRGFLWTRNCVVTFGLAIAGFSLDLLRGSYFRFQIPDSRFQIPDFRFVAASALLRGLAGFRFQISDFRF